MTFKMADRIIRKTDVPRSTLIRLDALALYWGCSEEELAAHILDKGLKFYCREAVEEGGILWGDQAILCPTEDTAETARPS